MSDYTLTTEFIDMLPITREFILAYPNRLYIYYTVMRHQLTNLVASFSNNSSTVSFDLTTDYLPSRLHTCIDRRNFNAVAKSLTPQMFVDTIGGYVTYMPFEDWDRFDSFVSQFPARARNSWVKLILFLYCGIDSIGGFYYSVDGLARTLSMDHSDVSSKLIALEEAGLLERGSFNSNAGLSRTYSWTKGIGSYRMRRRAEQMEVVVTSANKKF